MSQVLFEVLAGALRRALCSQWPAVFFYLGPMVYFGFVAWFALCIHMLLFGLLACWLVSWLAGCVGLSVLGPDLGPFWPWRMARAWLVSCTKLQMPTATARRKAGGGGHREPTGQSDLWLGPSGGGPKCACVRACVRACVGGWVGVCVCVCARKRAAPA